MKWSVGFSIRLGAAGRHGAAIRLLSPKQATRFEKFLESPGSHHENCNAASLRDHGSGLGRNPPREKLAILLKCCFSSKMVREAQWEFR
jgi:hypothetical protein